MNEVWGVDYPGTTRTLDPHIVHLRKKVEKEPDAPAVIQTVHGIGCRYVSARGTPWRDDLRVAQRGGDLISGMRP